MAHQIDWTPVTADHVVAALDEYDTMGADAFFAEHGFAPTLTYDLIWNGRAYPPKAILGRAYELATGTRLQPDEFEGGKSGAAKILPRLGFDVQPKAPR